jgi:hypothetical protein
MEILLPPDLILLVKGVFGSAFCTCFCLKKTKAESKGIAFSAALTKAVFHSTILKAPWEVLLPAVRLTFWYWFKIRRFFKFEIRNFEKNQLFKFYFF